jgi:hypothetical protein
MVYFSTLSIGKGTRDSRGHVIYSERIRLNTKVVLYVLDKVLGLWSKGHTLEKPTKADRGDTGISTNLTPALEWNGWSPPHTSRFTHGTDLVVPILQETGWAAVPVWMGAEKLAPQPEFDHRTVQPVASFYIDYAIPAHSRAVNTLNATT